MSHQEQLQRGQIHDIVALTRSEPSDLDQTAERRLNSRYCSYSDEI
jgi:hypothetical protein